MLTVKYQFSWPSNLRKEEFCSLSANQKQELHISAMFVGASERNDVTKQKTSHRCFLSYISLVGQTVSENKIFLYTLANQKQESHIEPCLLMDRDEMSNLYERPHRDAFCQILVHLDKQFQRSRFFLFQPIRNKNRP